MPELIAADPMSATSQRVIRAYMDDVVSRYWRRPAAAAEVDEAMRDLPCSRPAKGRAPWPYPQNRVRTHRRAHALPHRMAGRLTPLALRRDPPCPRCDQRGGHGHLRAVQVDVHEPGRRARPPRRSPPSTGCGRRCSSGAGRRSSPGARGSRDASCGAGNPARRHGSETDRRYDDRPPRGARVAFPCPSE